MKTNILATRPMILQEYTLTAFNGKSRRKKPGVVKLLPPPPQPDEKTLMELNALAAKHPFCVSHKVKNHDPL
ncbi:MAG TPA: hypothetical protein VNS58_26145 [Puia sp.]|jgi:hypothetical protein|nr:hypothetical protein [Puia sp.]